MHVCLVKSAEETIATFLSTNFGVLFFQSWPVSSNCSLWFCANKDFRIAWFTLAAGVYWTIYYELQGTEGLQQWSEISFLVTNLPLPFPLYLYLGQDTPYHKSVIWYEGTCRHSRAYHHGNLIWNFMYMSFYLLLSPLPSLLILHIFFSLMTSDDKLYLVFLLIWWLGDASVSLY